MPEAEQNYRTKHKFTIFHGYIHFLPHEEEEHDNDIESK